MMTPRGVGDVQVYTPERVEARYGVRPAQVPDFIGLKGDSSDAIPGVPGIGDKTAGALIGRYGSLEEVISHASELTPARAKAITEHAEQARVSKELATMRRNLELRSTRPRSSSARQTARSSRRSSAASSFAGCSPGSTRSTKRCRRRPRRSRRWRCPGARGRSSRSRARWGWRPTDGGWRSRSPRR